MIPKTTVKQKPHPLYAAVRKIPDSYSGRVYYEIGIAVWRNERTMPDGSQISAGYRPPGNSTFGTRNIDFCHQRKEEVLRHLESHGKDIGFSNRFFDEGAEGWVLIPHEI